MVLAGATTSNRGASQATEAAAFPDPCVLESGTQACACGPGFPLQHDGGTLQVAATTGVNANPGWLLDTTGFPARWNCGTWPPALGWLHIGSDVAIWGAYMAIPLILAYFVIRRRTPLPLVTWLFIAFIASCGISHLIEAVIFWHPVYRLAGVWKLLTATVSWGTVLALIPIVPRVLRWPSLEEVNQKLIVEVAERRAAEDRVRQIIEAAPVGMLMLDEAGRITMCNGELERTFGYSREELMGNQVEMLVPERFRSGHPGHREAFATHPTSRRMGGDQELCGRRKDGSEVPVDIGLNPISTPLGTSVLATVADTTPQRETEMKLKHLNQSLNTKNKELEYFVYAASHDLKDPLLSIQGYASMMDDGPAGDDDSSNREEYVARILHASERMEDIVNDLLELSRVGRVNIEHSQVDMRKTVLDVIHDLSAQVERADAEIVVEGEDLAIWFSERQLSTVFQNLIANAIRHGKPSMGQCHVHVGWDVFDEEVRFYVRDNGPGLPEEAHERVFGMFQRLSETTEGTGIGLTIVRRTAEAHGGRAWVESQPGRGATFYITLPLARLQRSADLRDEPAPGTEA